MKILYLNCVYGEGSTGKIVRALYSYAEEKGDEPFVAYGIGERSDDLNVVRVVHPVIRKAQSLRSRVTGYPYAGCVIGTRSTLRIIEDANPDLVHIHCINGYMVNIYRILEYLKANNIPTVITHHAEFMYTGGCTHAVDCEKWLTGCSQCKRIGKEHPISWFFDRTEHEWEMLRRAYTDFGRLHLCAVSDWVRDRARKSPFFREYPVDTVFNGLDDGVFFYTTDESIREQLGLRGSKVVVHATPNFGSRIKGGQHVLEMARRLPDVHFVIVGNPGTVARGPENCHFVGRVSDQTTLARYYSTADACILTSIRETFCMVVAESLCCGTPVVGFKAGGPETIALSGYGTFVEQGDDDALEQALRAELARTVDKESLSADARSVYGDKTMCENYWKIYEELLSGKSQCRSV